MKTVYPNKLPRERREALLEEKRASSCTVDSIGFPIPTSYEEYLMLTDEQKFRLYEITKKPNAPAQDGAVATSLKPVVRCLICQKPMTDYEPMFCCSGHECGCMGLPTNPQVCSQRCMTACLDGIGKTMEQRRIDAGTDCEHESEGFGMSEAINGEYPPVCGSVPDWAAAEIRATWRAARDAGNQRDSFRIIERMVDRLGYGRTENNPSLAQNAAGQGAAKPYPAPACSAGGEP